MVARSRCRFSIRQMLLATTCLILALGILNQFTGSWFSRYVAKKKLASMGASHVTFNSRNEVVSVAFSGDALQLCDIEQFSTIQRLDFSTSRVDGRVLPQLEGLENLTYLSFAHTALSDEDFQLLPSLPNLTYLRLDHTSISDAVFPHLSTLPRVLGVDVTGTVVSDQGIADFQKARPHVEFMR